jgi:hypothetical protein
MYFVAFVACSFHLIILVTIRLRSLARLSSQYLAELVQTQQSLFATSSQLRGIGVHGNGSRSDGSNVFGVGDLGGDGSVVHWPAQLRFDSRPLATFTASSSSTSGNSAAR